MNKDLAQWIVKGYKKNAEWDKILSQLDLNNALRVNKASLPFVPELFFTNTDLYFLLRPMTPVKNHADKVTSLSTLS